MSETQSIITQQLDEARNDPRSRTRLILDMPFASLLGEETREWICDHGTTTELQYLNSVDALMRATARRRAALADNLADVAGRLYEEVFPGCEVPF